MKGPWPSWAERERQATAARLRLLAELDRLRAIEARAREMAVHEPGYGGAVARFILGPDNL